MITEKIKEALKDFDFEVNSVEENINNPFFTFDFFFKVDSVEKIMNITDDCVINFSSEKTRKILRGIVKVRKGDNIIYKLKNFMQKELK